MMVAACLYTMAAGLLAQKSASHLSEFVVLPHRAIKT
jgi:hypothetical protein